MMRTDFVIGVVRRVHLNFFSPTEQTHVASNVEGSPFGEFYTTGNTGRFLGFMACLIQASFTIAGTDNNIHFRLLSQKLQ